MYWPLIQLILTATKSRKWPPVPHVSLHGCTGMHREDQCGDARGQGVCLHCLSCMPAHGKVARYRLSEDWQTHMTSASLRRDLGLVSCHRRGQPANTWVLLLSVFISLRQSLMQQRVALNFLLTGATKLIVVYAR